MCPSIGGRTFPLAEIWPCPLSTLHLAGHGANFGQHGHTLAELIEMLSHSPTSTAIYGSQMEAPTISLAKLTASPEGFTFWFIGAKQSIEFCHRIPINCTCPSFPVSYMDLSHLTSISRCFHGCHPNTLSLGIWRNYAQTCATSNENSNMSNNTWNWSNSRIKFRHRWIAKFSSWRQPLSLKFYYS